MTIWIITFDVRLYLLTDAYCKEMREMISMNTTVKIPSAATGTSQPGTSQPGQCVSHPALIDSPVRSPDPPSIGEFIKCRRKELNLTLREMSRNISIDHSTVSRIENGLFNDFSLQATMEIAEALHYDPQYLLALRGAGIESPEMRYINRAWHKMSGQEHREMLDLLIKTFPQAFSGVEHDDLDMNED